MTPLERAIEIAGSQSALGDAIGKKQQHVQYWLSVGKVPGEYVIPIEKAVEGRVTRHELRPDLYPVDPLAEGSTR